MPGVPKKPRIACGAFELGMLAGEEEKNKSATPKFGVAGFA
jgi:hypothetical protein